MAKPKPIDNPEYTELLRQIAIGKYKRKETQKLLYPHLKDSTFSDKIKALEYGMHLIKSKGYNHQSLFINYSGCASFMFETFFKKYLIKYRKSKLWKIDYSCKDMELLLKTYFENYLIPKQKEIISIRQLFEKPIFIIGNHIRDGYTKGFEFVRVYKSLKKQNMLEVFRKLYASEEYNIYFDFLEFTELSKKSKTRRLQRAITYVRKMTSVEAFKVFGLFSFLYYCEFNNIDLGLFIKNAKEKLSL